MTGRVVVKGGWCWRWYNVVTWLDAEDALGSSHRICGMAGALWSCWHVYYLAHYYFEFGCLLFKDCVFVGVSLLCWFDQLLFVFMCCVVPKPNFKVMFMHNFKAAWSTFCGADHQWGLQKVWMGLCSYVVRGSKWQLSHAPFKRVTIHNSSMQWI